MCARCTEGHRAFGAVSCAQRNKIDRIGFILAPINIEFNQMWIVSRCTAGCDSQIVAKVALCSNLKRNNGRKVEGRIRLQQHHTFFIARQLIENNCCKMTDPAETIS